MRINLALPERRVFKVDLYPKTYFPLFIVNANLELIVSPDFFPFLETAATGAVVGAADILKKKQGNKEIKGLGFSAER